MKVYSILLLLAFSSAKAQPVKKITTTPAAVFPKSFKGNWKGTLYWYKQGNKIPQSVPMELRIQPVADTPGHYTWNLMYGKPTEDNRPYILKPVDTAKGHWLIDELNTIIIDQYWIGNKFCGSFSVQGNTIINNYWIEKELLHAEFLTIATRPIATTGNAGPDVPPVDSYEVKSYQKAILRRY